MGMGGRAVWVGGGTEVMMVLGGLQSEGPSGKDGASWGIVGGTRGGRDCCRATCGGRAGGPGMGMGALVCGPAP